MKKRWLYLVLAMLMVMGLLTGCKKKASVVPEATTTTIAATTAVETKTEKTTIEETTIKETTIEETTVGETEAITQVQTETQTEEASTEAITEAPAEPATEAAIDENGSYNTKDEVALYLHTYGHLPDNYVTKKEAQNMGWDNSDRNKSLDKVAPGYSIGGDKFGNYEGLLPKAKGRQYYECDIEYTKGSRNAKRIIFSNDGLIFYTEDHYESFTQLY